MKIGIVVGAYNTTGGLERVAVEYARGLSARGHELRVFTQSLKRGRGDGPIRFHRVGGPRSHVTTRALTFPINATREVDRHPLDVVLAFGSVVLRPAVLRTPGCHKSWWEVASKEWPVSTADGLRRRLNPHHRITLGWDRKVLGSGLPITVLAAGDWAADDIKRFYPAVAGKVEVLPDGVNLDEFAYDRAGRAALRARWEADEGPLLFTLATEQRRKGLDTLFEAFRLIHAELPSARLVVGGRTPVADVRALAVAHRVAGAVRAVGFIDDLAAAYSAADVLVFPTRFDPWGLPVVEALACGTPVAVSARAGASIAVRDGETGSLIAEPSDPRRVAAATLKALVVESGRADIRATVERFAWTRVVDTLEPFLEWAARTRGDAA